MNTGARGEIEDVVYTLRPSREFVAEVKGPASGSRGPFPKTAASADA